MGSGIGQIPGAIQQVIAPAQPAGRGLDPPNFGPALDQATTSGLAQSGAGTVTGQEQSAPPPEAGFGAGTVSGPAAALDALGRGVAAAREVVPSLEEIRVQFQTARAENAQSTDVVSEQLRSEFAERGEALESRVPEANAQGLNAFNRARAFTELQPTEPPEVAVEAVAAQEAAAAGGPEVDADAIETSRPAPAEVASDVFDRVGRERLDVTA